MTLSSAILSSHFVILSESEGSFLPKNEKILKIFSKKFGSKDFYRTFAIPIQRRGGGEMVDTLLWGGSGSNPVRVRVSPTAPRDQHKRWSLFFVYPRPTLQTRESVGADFPSNLYRRCQKNRIMNCAPKVGHNTKIYERWFVPAKSARSFNARIRGEYS